MLVTGKHFGKTVVNTVKHISPQASYAQEKEKCFTQLSKKESFGRKKICKCFTITHMENHTKHVQMEKHGEHFPESIK